MDDGNGFLKLQEENSRRSSVFRQNKEFKGGLPYTTRLNCGCGQCIPFQVKVEKEEGSLRIGKLTLAPNCHLILIIFGFFFLLAGTVLTALAYKSLPSSPDPEQLRLRHAQEDPVPRKDERIAGPLFVIIGSSLVFLGIALAILCYKLNKEAQRQRASLNRFSLDGESHNTQSPDFINSDYFSSSGFANIDDLRSQGGDGRSRRGSFFGNSFNNARRNTLTGLTTIAQAVPIGFFMSDSPRTPKTPGPGSPRAQLPNSSDALGTDSNGFQEIELSSPKKQSSSVGIQRQQSSDDEFNLPALTLRPSIPIFIFGGMPMPTSNRNIGPLDARHLVISSRSDEPFGSIASLSTGKSGDIACFPSVHYTPPVIITLPEDEELHAISTGENNNDISRNLSYTTSELPPININELGNALTATGKIGQRRSLKGSRSEDHSDNEKEIALERRGSSGA